MPMNESAGWHRVIASSGVVTLVLATGLVAHTAAAEIRIEQRDDSLCLKNLELPPSAVAPASVAPSAAPSVARPPASYRDLIRAAASRHGLAPELVESRPDSAKSCAYVKSVSNEMGLLQQVFNSDGRLILLNGDQ